MATEKLKQQLLKKGFKPVQQTSRFTVLKSPSGAAIFYPDGNVEGFISHQLSESLDEIKVRHLIESLAIIGIALTYFTTDVTIVNGASMEPTYHTGNVIIKSKACQNINKLMVSRNAIVKFTSPDGDQCIKRIAGVPGDTIEFKGAEIYINGKLVDSSNLNYLMKQKQKALAAFRNHQKNSDILNKTLKAPEVVKLKPNQYFLLGDNRDVSVDSRDYGPVPMTSFISLIKK